MFLVGFCVGAEVVAVLAAKTSRTALAASQLLFGIEENRLLAKAWGAGDFDQALVHASCRLESEHGEASARAFGSDLNVWTLGFAIREVLLDKRGERSKSLSEQAIRAQLAVIWERQGKPDAAAREYRRLATLTGKNDPAKWRKFGEAWLDGLAKSERAPTD